jgi:hypothetical protein
LLVTPSPGVVATAKPGGRLRTVGAEEVDFTSTPRSSILIASVFDRLHVPPRITAMALVARGLYLTRKCPVANTTIVVSKKIARSLQSVRNLPAFFEGCL